MKAVVIQQEELECIIRHLSEVKQSGYGKVLIQIQQGKLVYITHEIGEKLKLDNYD